MDAAFNQPDNPDQIPTRSLGHHLALTVYWLSNSLLWGALLHLGLQSRVSDWFGQDRVGYYIGVLGAVGGIVGTATQMIVGAFSDRSMHPLGRRRPFLMAGVMLAAGALILLGATKRFWAFAGALILVQLFSNAALGPFTALLPDTVNPREHGKASGFMGVARLLGDVGGLMLAAMFLSTGSLGEYPSREALAAFHAPRFFEMCLLMAGFMLVTMIVCVLTIKERPLQQRFAFPECFFSVTTLTTVLRVTHLTLDCECETGDEPVLRHVIPGASANDIDGQLFAHSTGDDNERQVDPHLLHEV